MHTQSKVSWPGVTLVAVLLVAGFIWLGAGLVHETQCATIRGDWMAGLQGPSPAHIVETVNGETVVDRYQPVVESAADIARGQQRMDEAQAHYAQTGCTGDINPNVHMMGN